MMGNRCNYCEDPLPAGSQQRTCQPCEAAREQRLTVWHADQEAAALRFMEAEHAFRRLAIERVAYERSVWRAAQALILSDAEKELKQQQRGAA